MGDAGVGKRQFIFIVLTRLPGHSTARKAKLLMQIRHEDISTALLLVSAQLVEHGQVQSPEQLDAPSQPASQTQTVLDQYADSILARHAKFLHQQLGSTIRYRANATLYLLAAITSRGTPLTTQVVKTLDMSLPALVNLAHPPK